MEKPTTTAQALRANLLTDAELAAAFGRDASTIRRWRLREGLPFTRVGVRPMIDVEDAKRWLERRKVNSGSAA